jgi:ABC-type sugar transport system ATPase subunit
LGNVTVAVRGLSKHYGGVTALSNVNLDIVEGEVLALVGDNGAGKSTLVKLLAGVEQPSEGAVAIGGERVTLHSAHDARRRGIETVHQSLALAPNVAVWGNVFLGREVVTCGWRNSLRWVGWLNRGEMRRTTLEQLGDLHVTVPGVNAPVKVLSGGQRQAAAVARGAAWAMRLLILDEPTAALGPEQQKQIVELIRRIRDRGMTVLLVSHSIRQVMDVADRIAVLRRGELTAVVQATNTTEEEVIGFITGTRRQESNGAA